VGVPVYVDHRPEVVEVQDDQGNRVVFHTRALDVGSQALVEAAVVQQPSQRVGGGQA
jgi:hypothetical protein